MRIYRDVELVESLGSGIPRILRAYGEDCFKFTDNFIRVILPISAHDTAHDIVGDMSEIKLPERQRKILDFIKGSPTITAKQMSEMLSVSQRTIERDISMMKEKGILRREGKDNDGVWVIVDLK